MKKLLSLILVVIMIATMSIVVFADEQPVTNSEPQIEIDQTLSETLNNLLEKAKEEIIKQKEIMDSNPVDGTREIEKVPENEEPVSEEIEEPTKTNLTEFEPTSIPEDETNVQNNAESQNNSSISLPAIIAIIATIALVILVIRFKNKK